MYPMKKEAVRNAAFLRGIGPGDPKKSNASLRSVFEKLGFTDVTSFISSGNILFSSSEKDTEKLEKIIEAGFKKQLGIEIGTFIRSMEALKTFLETKPFGKEIHTPKTYLTVTFYKKAEKEKLQQFKKDQKGRVTTIDEKLKAVLSVIDTTTSKTPDFMVKLERALGKEITTRTINTVERISMR
jgi:uncharacterized protein (DUF1697 family)